MIRVIITINKTKQVRIITNGKQVAIEQLFG